MEKLLPYFERELGMLRRAGQEFATRYPKLAGSLQISGETCADPHVERLIQATALLNARAAKLLDDGYTGFTEALLGMLYPHYLRPIPACSIARVDYSGAKANEVGTTSVIPRGTEMKSLGQAPGCRFRSAYDVTIAPLRLAAVRYEPFIQVPSTLRLAADITSAISITIESTVAERGLDQMDVQSLRVFIDGEASLCAAVRDALFLRAACACVEVDGRWHMLERVPLAPAGFADADALLPFAASEHAAYRLLGEYFACPEKFDFFDIDLAALLAHCPPRCTSLTVHLALADLRADAAAARILKSLSPDRLVLGCTPVVNLFAQHATPIHITHARSSYPLLPDDMPASCCEIYSVDAVQLLHKTGAAATLTEFSPYYGLRHGESRQREGRYWLVRRDEDMAACGAGHEYTLALVDRDFSPLQMPSATASVELTCTNRDLPYALQCGRPGGDLHAETCTTGFPIRLLRRPTQSQQLATSGSAHWSLIAHLALNHRSLTQEGLPALAAMLRLYAAPDNAVAQRQIDGITGLAHRPARAWLHQRDGAAYLNGIEVQLTLDEQAYAGSGIHLFAQLLDRYFGLHVHLNSFTQLTILSHANGKELLRCPPRNGALALA